MRKAIFALSLSLASVTHAYEGGSSSGGGNFREMEFHARIDKLVEIVRQDAVSKIFQEAFAVEDLERLSHEVRVEFVASTLFKDGVLKDALNFPEDVRVLVSIPSWDALAARAPEKDLLVFHELLGLLRVDDSKYALSRKLLPQILNFNQSRCLENPDYQVANIEGTWTFNDHAPVWMKTEIVASGETTLVLRVRACDRLKTRAAQGACVPATTPKGHLYPDFLAHYSFEEGRFIGPGGYSLKVDCSDHTRLVYEQDRNDGFGLSYLLHKL